ncbi:MAG: hypothetical protein Q8K96_04375 [Rubrivivax sp.]|nr:hypothetical protein [Rubrivivax sp.]
MISEEVPAFQPLTGIYEPSAIQQLPGGRLLVVEDEKNHPLSLVTIGADGGVDSTALTAGLFHPDDATCRAGGSSPGTERQSQRWTQY